MPRSKTKTILLTGAPESTSLQWTNESLVATLLPAFSTDSRDVCASPQGTADGPVWRRLPLDKEVLHTGYTPNGHGWKRDAMGFEYFDFPFMERENLALPGLSFETPGNQNRAVDEDIDNDEITKFYSHSLFTHEELPSSQIIAAEDLADPTTSFPTSDSNHTSFSLASLDNETTATSEPSLHPKPLSLSIRDLKTLPTINYLHSIKPRRMTVNLIVAIVAIPPPLQLITRHAKRRIDLVEMTVSDETKSGFGINLWLPPADDPSRPDATASPLLKIAASKLRPRDVVLLRNVELNVHEKRVFGQNLRRDGTEIYLLYRDRVDLADVRGVYRRKDLNEVRDGDLQLAKVRRVRDWVMDFGPVGIDGRRDGEGSGLEALPPDSTLGD